MTTPPITVMHVQKFAGIAGSEGHLRQLLPALGRSHVTPRLVMLGGVPTPRESAYVDGLEAEGVEVRRFRLRGDVDPILVASLTRYFRRARPDIVHTHLVHADLHAGLAARLARVPVVISTKHNDDRFRRRWPMTWVERGIVSLTDHTVTISEALRAFHLAGTHDDPARVTTILYGVDAPTWTDAQTPADDIRREFGLPTDAVVILSVGRLVDQKGHDVLLRALARMAADGAAPFVVIAGDGPTRRELEGLSNDLGVASRVRFVGWRDDIRRLMTSSTALAHPARWEGFGLVLLEAMAARLPIVASAVSAIPEVIGPDEAGLLVPPDDPAALAAALTRVLGDASVRQQLVDRAWERLHQRFSPARMAAEHQALYRSCLAASPPTWPSGTGGAG